MTGVVMEEQSQFRKGDSVRILGQECIGEIVGVSDRYATVAFQAMEVHIAFRHLEKAQLITAGGASVPPIQATKYPFNLDADKFSSFNPEIDLHGMSSHDALNVLDQWIDQACLLGYKQLKIIHGKGMGILRNAVRAYLPSHGRVRRIMAYHPYPGGEGVTCIEVD